MKDSVYTYQSVGNYGKTDLEILLDIGRPLTDNDKWALHQCVEDLTKKLNAETLRLRPETKEEYEKTKRELLGLFDGRMIHAKEIPNEYCDCSLCNQTSPWFKVTTTRGIIKLGWRKRVIAIDWSDINPKKGANELFPDEDVTKGDWDIHAWGYEKAKEYIDKILA